MDMRIKNISGTRATLFLYILLLTFSVPTFSQVSSFPYSEGFESDLGTWSQGSGDDIDWTRDSGGTPSTSTGPSAGSGSTWYVFIEASAPNNPSKRAYLENTFDFTGEFNPTLTFDYHMYGTNQGTLYVDVNDGAWNNGVWSITGQQQTSNGAAYITAFVDLSAFENRSNIIIRFRGVTGDDSKSDMAIDNIAVCTVDPGTATISTNMMCSAGTVDLSLSGQDGGGTIQWQESTDNVTFTDISGATTADYTTASLSTGSNYYFRAEVTNGCANYSNTVSVVVESGNGTINTFPYSQDFDTNQGSWTGATGDDFDWTRDDSGTPSNNTGPSTGNSGTFYMFTEASNPNNPNRSAFLDNTFDFTNLSDPELTFYYHMFGFEQGTMHVDVGADESVWSITGAQQISNDDDWKKATVNLSAYAGRCNVTIRFRGITGLGSKSDMAIDDVAVRDACFSVNGGTVSVSDHVLCAAGTVDLSVVGQDGGATLQWQQSTDNITFTDISGATSPNATTGTLSTGNTYYFRAEVTNVCDAYSDTVSVIVNSGGGISSYPYSEGFESGLGSWTQGSGDDFDWTRDSGGTPSTITGPSAGNSSTWYVYTEASGANSPYQTAFLEADFDFTGINTPILSFYYHMYGNEMGTLHVDANGTEVFSISGEQQSLDTDPWRLASVDLSAYANECNVTIRFRGETGAESKSDMAIDDVAICTVAPGTATISNSALCAAGTVDLSVDGYDGSASIQWQESTDNVTFTNISGATSQDHTTSTLSTGNTYYFRAALTNGCTTYSNTVSVAVTTGGGESTFPYSEGFESGFGNWTQSATDDFDWTRTNTNTPSNETGASGANGGSFFIFTEASGANSPGQTASLEQEFNFTSATSPILSFFYHMYGIETGTLFVDVNNVNIWSLSGQQQSTNADDWEQASIDLSAYAGECSATIRFRVVTGADSKGDISLDDIAVCEKPVTSSITGSTDVCKSATGEAYSVTNNVGNTYTWIIDGGVQASGTTTNSITIDWGATGKVGSIKVLERSGECVGDTVTLNVNIHTIETSAISGNTNIAEGTNGVAYSVTNTTGYSYAWTISGGTQASGTTTNSITVDWGAAGAGNVSVIATSTSPSCSAAPAVNLAVTKYTVFATNGTGGGNWNDINTWACSCIPLSTQNVQILNGDVVTLAQNETIDNMVIDAGGTVNNSTFTLTVNGDYTNNGTHSGTGIIDLAGTDTSIDGTGTISTSGDLQISGGNKTILSTASLNKTSGDVDITAGNIVVTNNGSIIIAGNLDALNGTDTWTNSATGSLNVSGSLLSSGALDASAAGNTVTYGVAGAQTIKLPNASQYYNLILTTSGTKSLAGNIIVRNDLTISSSAQLDLTASNYDINVGGDWTNSSSNGDPFVQRSGTITFDGSSGNQTMTNTNDETFFDLVINKASGELTMATNSDIIVTNSLTLTNGLISPTSSETVTINDNATATSTTSSYVNGKVIKIGNDAFVFPIGKNSNRGQLGISAPGTGSTFEAEYFDAAYSDRSVSGLDHVSGIEYWVLDRTVGADAVSVTLYWDSGTRSDIKDISGTDLRVAHYTGTWTDEGGTVSGILSTGSVTSGTILSFSPFTFGSLLGFNPLPVEMTSFTANLSGSEVNLHWTTATELNNDHFEIQRSGDGKNFSILGKVNGNGTTSLSNAYSYVDKLPLSGISYYRLKQVDFDGAFEFSQTVILSNQTLNEGMDAVLFPNPAVHEEVKLQLTSEDETTPIDVQIFDLSGQLIFNQRLELNQKGETFKITNSLPPGMYQVLIRQGFSQLKKRLIVK